MVSLLVAQALPLVAQAAKLDLYNPRKHYGDEKVVISDADSRCVGAAFNKLYSDAQAQAKKDLAKQVDKDGNVSKTVADAYKVYGRDIALGWAAMKEPYCGFGAFGVSAAKKSFTKTISHARSEFLAKAAKKSAKETFITASTLSLFPTTTETVPASTQAAPLPDDPVVAAPTPEVTSTPVDTTPVPKVTAPNTASVTISHILKRGQRSAEVKALQAFLIKKGYLEADSDTGYFGPQTEKAVIAFQKAKNIISSSASAGAGQVGPRTRSFVK